MGRKRNTLITENVQLTAMDEITFIRLDKDLFDSQRVVENSR